MRGNRWTSSCNAVLCVMFDRFNGVRGLSDAWVFAEDWLKLSRNGYRRKSETILGSN